MKWFLGIFGTLVLAAGLIFVSMFFKRIEFRKQCVSYEAAIEAQDKQILNVDTVLTNSLKSQGLAVDEYKSLLKDAFVAAVSARYGQTGSRAAMQWIKEQNPNIDSSVIKKLQAVIEVGYAKFETAQKTKIERVRSYKSFVEKKKVDLFGDWYTEGYPRKPWETWEKIYVSEETKTMQDTGIQKAKTLR